MWEQFIDDWESTRSHSEWICESCIQALRVLWCTYELIKDRGKHHEYVLLDD